MEAHNLPNAKQNVNEASIKNYRVIKTLGKGFQSK
jgi:hypothetical protein